MKLWLSKNSEVPIREQLLVQISLGIASGDLKPGDKLPSTRELGRRFEVHPNTVSAAYRELSHRGLAEFRQGSGVYVAEEGSRTNDDLDALIKRFLNDASRLGYTTEHVSARFLASLRPRKRSCIVVAESSGPLREILVAELGSAAGCDVKGIAVDDIPNADLSRVQLAALFDEAEKVDAVLPPGTDCIYLRANSPSGSLTGRQRPGPEDLIAIASAWDDFLLLAKLFLIAADVAPESIVSVLRSDSSWRRSLAGVSTIVCDSLTASLLADDDRVRIFPIVAEESLERLCEALRG